MTPGSSEDALAVGAECPYFKQGHETCRIETEGGVCVLVGPGGERFYRTAKLRNPRHFNSIEGWLW